MAVTSNYVQSPYQTPNPYTQTGYQPYTSGWIPTIDPTLQQSFANQNEMKTASALQSALEEARWQRVMGFLGSTGLMGQFQAGNQYGGQVSALAAEQPLRGYAQRKRDISNRYAARGMSLSGTHDYSLGQAQGGLSQALATAGTAGDVAQKQLSFNLLAELLRLGGRA